MRHLNPAGRHVISEQGRRVFLREPVRDDEREFLALMKASRRLHNSFVSPPLHERAFHEYLEKNRRPDFQGFLICRNEDGIILGAVNISQIFRGNFHSAYLGYFIGEPYARQGYMTEALNLVLHHAFETLKLHRLEANVQPENAPSLRLVQRCGFEKEGFSPRYLKIRNRWRDHERWAIRIETWKALRARL